MTCRSFRLFPSVLKGIRAVEARTRHSFPKHTHDEFGIGVIYDGAQKSLSGRGIVEAGPGDIITVNPEEVHDGSPIGESGRAWKMLYFDPALIADTFRDIDLDGRHSCFELENPVMKDRSLAHRFLNLFAAVTDTATGTGPWEERMLLLLASMLRTAPPQPETAETFPTIRRARERIDDLPGEDISLAELAELCGVSRFQLIRGFSRATGLTPHTYLVQRRLHKARRLICSGISLAQAAAASGFADQSHMTRLFSRNYGYPPGAYARAYANRHVALS